MNLLVDPPAVAVLIPTYNRFNVTNKCIDILLESIDSNFIIVICDSNSSDSTPSLWKKANKIHVINVGGSEWWSGAVNAGIEFSLNLGISKLILLNDDITWWYYMMTLQDDTKWVYGMMILNDEYTW